MYPSLFPISESAVSITFGEVLEDAVWQQIERLRQQLQEAPFEGLLSVVPAFLTLTVHFDPFLVFQRWPQYSTPAMAVMALLEEYLQPSQKALPDLPSTTIEIPIRYGGKHGMDLPEVAHKLNRSEANVIQLHSARLYKVFMIGFAPGFPYLGLLPPELALDRKTNITQRVPAGSVAIATNLTCIYPQQSPAGWHVIGQTEVQLFDPFAKPPCLLRAGMHVRFVPQ